MAKMRTGVTPKTEAFILTRQFLGEEYFGRITQGPMAPDTMARNLLAACQPLDLPPWLKELIPMETHVLEIKDVLLPNPSVSQTFEINPALKLFSNTWRHLGQALVAALTPGVGKEPPVPGQELVMVWQDPVCGMVKAGPASNQDLLVLKMAEETLSPEQVAMATGAHLTDIRSALVRALDKGIVIGPDSGICRLKKKDQTCEDKAMQSFDRPRVFALQWHITQACDLHCRHCYDRSFPDPLGFSKELAILDSFEDFCCRRGLYGQISFTGGNPLLHPNFHRLYKEAVDRGFFIGILGNPAAKEEIQRLTAMGPLSFFQVSLEGLESHNDYIRGRGHFIRTMDFLEVLKDCRIYAKVMLTLTRDNMDQVIPLGKHLRGRADFFTFNRLSLAGEGAALTVVDPKGYREFLKSYLTETRSNPVLGLKDNLFNILLDEDQLPLFGGCTGYGCGAAFNFVSVLATGEVHACRKFHSPIGDLTRQSLVEIYDSEQARRYRQGPAQCMDCRLNRVCRGCLASTTSLGLDLFEQTDPYCFLST